MPASPIELKNFLSDPDLNPGRRELSAPQPSRHCGGTGRKVTLPTAISGEDYVAVSTRQSSPAFCLHEYRMQLTAKYDRTLDVGDLQ